MSGLGLWLESYRMVFTKLLLAWVFGPDLYCSSSSSSSSCSLWKPSWQRCIGPDYCKTRGAWFPRCSSVAPIIYIYRAAGAEDFWMFCCSYCCCIPSSFVSSKIMRLGFSLLEFWRIGDLGVADSASCVGLCVEQLVGNVWGKTAEIGKRWRLQQLAIASRQATEFPREAPFAGRLKIAS
jgi:hypothetical protein